MFSAAQRGKAYIVGKSPVDRGILRNAWKVIKLSATEVELTNDQPYAGIMERGSKPFKISSDGMWALKGWVFRKLKSGQMFAMGAHTQIKWAKGWNKSIRTAKGQSQITSKRNKGHTTFRTQAQKEELEKQAEQIAWAIAKSFEKVGMKGKWFVRDNLTILAQLMDAEIQRSLSVFFNRSL